MFVDSFGVTHPAYTLMEEAETQGEERNQNMEPDSGGIENTDSYCQGEQKSSKEKGHIAYDDDDDIPLVYLISKKLRLRLRTELCQPLAMIVPKSQENPVSDSPGEEIAALKVSHSAAMDQLHISYGLENAGLVEENSRLKEEIATTQATLETERTSNSAHLKYIVDLLAKGSPSSSSCVPPSI
uniref:Uncharacterized protein n=1 Tax=Solanum tuberosum TaxID=4113 RepID=M1DL05_SOLTU